MVAIFLLNMLHEFATPDEVEFILRFIRPVDEVVNNMMVGDDAVSLRLLAAIDATNPASKFFEVG
ncbi:MAG: hypothetical protein AAF938_24300, partial [Myxococcota bacterium]